MGYVPGNPPSGVFQQRNVASTFMLFAVVASALIVQSGELKAKWQKPAIFIINALAIWVLVLNSSRIATLSLFVVLVLSAPWLLRKADIKAYRLMLLGIASGLAIAHIIPLLSGAAETANVMRVEREMFADSGRMTIWKVTWELIKEKPWFGWGYGSFEYFYVMKQAELYHAGEISRMMHNMSHPHNELLYWVSEAGLIPVLTIIGVLGWQLVRLASNCREKALFFPSMLVAPVLHCTTELPFYHSALLLLMSGVLLCVASSNTTESTNQSFSCKFTIATSLVSTIVVTSSLFFLASGLQAHQQLGKFIKSEYTDIEALQQIVVPVAISNRYQYYSWKLLLNNSPADTESGRKHIENVCRWSNSRFQDTGKRMYLESQKTALEKLNDTERLRVVYDQITYLFPDSEFP
ncbi:hypothetical protein GCM10007895_26850 [Paraferrimonas sedimenticola]|uniref:Virulence factor membrane-bound polymerase C-terminal domain-containing protein n=2 Tax=Paraferrimonas sedimenticola TaxID=375674 RepID=A0AA37W253_9GAMM|nr:hypothetical protein GCM10007895_26850 [Paraferrimonas sedimenticola]